MTVTQLGDTLKAIDRGAVLGILGAADTVLATKQLAERQALALTKVRELHRPTRYSNSDAPAHDCCHACSCLAAPRYVGHPCETVHAIDEAGA